MYDDLTKAGFTVDQKKSDFVPKQVREWLGTIIDTRNMTFSVPPKKVSELRPALRQALHRSTVTPKELARLADTSSSLYLAIGQFW